MPITAGTSSALPGPLYSSAPRSNARFSATRASTTRQAIAGAQGPWATMNAAAWLAGSALST